MTVRSREVVAGALVGAGLISSWLDTRLQQDWPLPLAALLLGCGIAAAAWFDLRGLPIEARQTLRGEAPLRGLWRLGRVLFLLAVGWSIAFAGAVALFLGWDGLMEGIRSRPGLLMVAVGLCLVGIGVGRLLDLDEPPSHGWEAVFRFPFRLVGLPTIVIGMGLTVLGAAQTLAPDWMAEWVRSHAAGWLMGG